jgi:hypothetical protein
MVAEFNVIVGGGCGGAAESVWRSRKHCVEPAPRFTVQRLEDARLVEYHGAKVARFKVAHHL